MAVYNKKYWSEGEYIKADGTDYTGYVGISGNKAYIFDTNELLNNKSNFLTEFNTSGLNFDRLLQYSLILPYTKKSIQFQANDFLYSGTIKDILYKLQTNNNYIYKNATIGNTLIPNTDTCHILATEDNSAYKFIKIDKSGKTKLFEVWDKTELYPAVEIRTDEVELQDYILNPAYDEETYGNIPEEYAINYPKIYPINNGDKPLSQYPSMYKYIPNTKLIIDLKEGQLKNYNLANQRSTRTALDPTFYYQNYQDKEEFKSKVFSLFYSNNENYKQEYVIWPFNLFYKKDDAINSDFEDLRVPLSIDYPEYNLTQKSNFLKLFELEDDTDLDNILDAKYIKQFIERNKLNKFKYIPKIVRVNDGDISTYKFEIIIDTDTKLQFESFSELNTEYIEKWKKNKKNAYECNSYYINETEYFNHEDEILSYFKENSDYNENSLIAPFYGLDDIDDSLIPVINDNAEDNDASKTFKIYYSDESSDFEQYKYIPCVRGYYETDEDSGRRVLVRKFYPTSEASVGESGLKPFANFKDVDKELIRKYKKNYCVLNKNYYELKYKVLETDTDAVRTEKERNLKLAKFKYLYKSILSDENVNDIAADLFDDASKTLKNYRYIPLIKSIAPPFNFDDIVQTEIRVTNVEYNEQLGKKLSILLFILFVDKLVLIKYEYYPDNDNTNTSSGSNIDFNKAYKRYDDKNTNNYGRIVYNNESENILVLDVVDPDSSNSLKFIGLKDMEIHNNYLYMVDSELNMALRYDISYLLNDDTEAAWTIKSLRLLDMLQGEGTAKDQIYFNKPCSISASDDFIYIADGGNKCVKVFSESFDFYTFYKSSNFSRHNLQAVSVNPYKFKIDGKEIPENSVWVFSTTSNSLFITIMSNGEQVYYSQIDKLHLLKDSYTWDEEFKSVKFSFCESNYFYICTTKRVYKLHLTKPAYPFASLSYFKQRIALTTMVWSRSYWQWHALPAGEGDDDLNITWSYRPPSSSAEVLDNRGLAITGVDSCEHIEGTDTEKQFNGDLTFHIGTLYDQSKADTYIKRAGVKFKEIPRNELSGMIKASGVFLYNEQTSYISSLTNLELPCYIDEEIINIAPTEYINPLTFNKIIYKVVYNLITLKNAIIGNFQGGYNIDNIMIYDSIILDEYFQRLSVENIEDFFIHENEPTSIIVNRIFERIWDLQHRLIRHMQTTYIAQPSFTNNSFRII